MSPPTTSTKHKAVAGLQEKALTLRFAMEKARVICLPTAAERRQRRTKKAIRVLNEVCVEEDQD
jgi:hypothetical protein